MPLAKIRCHSRNSDTRTLLLVCVEHTTLKYKNSTVALAGHACFSRFFRMVLGAVSSRLSWVVTACVSEELLVEEAATARFRPLFPRSRRWHQGHEGLVPSFHWDTVLCLGARGGPFQPVLQEPVAFARIGS